MPSSPNQFQDYDISALEDQAVVQIDPGRRWTRKVFHHFRRNFDDMFLVLFKANRVHEVFPNPPSSTDEIFKPQGLKIDFNVVSAYLRWVCTQAARETLSISYTYQLLFTVSSYPLMITGESMERGLWLESRHFIQSDLKLEFNLQDKVKRIHAGIDDIKLLASSFMQPDFGVNVVRARWQMLLFIAILTQTSLRAGSLVSPDPYPELEDEHRDLVWGDLQLVIHRADVDDHPNDLVIKFRAPNGKTGESSFLMSSCSRRMNFNLIAPSSDCANLAV